MCQLHTVLGEYIFNPLSQHSIVGNHIKAHLSDLTWCWLGNVLICSPSSGQLHKTFKNKHTITSLCALTHEDFIISSSNALLKLLNVHHGHTDINICTQEILKLSSYSCQHWGDPNRSKRDPMLLPLLSQFG